MPTASVSPEIGELTANLATPDDSHRFGVNEFMIRVIALRIAAKACEQHLTQKSDDDGSG